jgi:2-succinyl-5-enolpyruvyl-6-hydroxy-3-cyclohexene-1-carboxylate synthase
MTPTADTYKLLRAFVDELARCGMRAACTSPGSRSTPLVLSLAREQRLRCYSHVDERCAGFFALGLAKASARPVAVACTSGTAAAELLPAVIEAHEARVPLLVLTADRPWELRENGAGQAIDQLKLYGGATKWFFEVGVHDADAQQLRWIRTLACRAYWTALEGRPGAVHLNFPLREPLVLDVEPPPEDSGRSDGRPIVRRPRASLAIEQEMSDLHKLIAVARRGVVLAGRHERQPSLGPAAAAFAESLEWPLLADPMSGARGGSSAIAHYDALLREPSLRRALVPDLIVRVGDLPVSKPLRTWLASLPHVRQVALDPDGAWQDPASVVSDSLPLEPVVALERMAKAFAAWVNADDDWLTSWRSADERAAEAILGVLGVEQISEPAVAAELGVLLPKEATLFVASSMPVRDIETFWPVRVDPPRVLCNRGANGIDGTVSSAFGAAAAGESPVVLLIGDVALAYDIGGLLAAKRLGLKLTIVLIDNGGGGIFDFLPLADTPLARVAGAAPGVSADAPATGEQHQLDEDIYTHHIATPTGLDFAAVAALYGLAHQLVASTSELRAALERAFSPDAGSTIVQVQSNRRRNVELHRHVWDAVSTAVSHTP